jgi:hypothetical protein
MSYHRPGGGLGLVGPMQPWTAATAGKWISERTRQCAPGTGETKVTVAGGKPTRSLIGHPTSTSGIKREDCFQTGRVREASRVGRARFIEWCCPKPPQSFCGAGEVEIKDPWFGRDKVPECRPSGHSYTYGGRTNEILCCPQPSTWDRERTLTQEEYNALKESKCPGDYRTSSGDTVPLTPQWLHAYGHIGSTRRVTDVREGPHVLVCKPEFGPVTLVAGTMSVASPTQAAAMASTTATATAAETEEAIVEEQQTRPPEQTQQRREAGAPGLPGWVLPVGIGAGLLAVGGIAWAVLRRRGE